MNKLPVYKTEGIILKTADWGDLDRLLTIYTRGYGKIRARAISARKKGSKLNGLLQNFTYGKFLLAKSKTIDIITDLEVADSYQYLHSNLANLGYAFYFAELVDKLVTGQERDDDLWRLILRAFEVLNNPPTPLCARGAEEKEFCVHVKSSLTPLKKGGAGGLNLSKLRVLFEDKLVEFLGQPSLKLWLASHPSLKIRTASHFNPAQRLDYLQSLAGERINSQKFLMQL
ncbi:MAG: DNA repair protein RecO [Candidatus Portnoybacteria bacterium]|nr:DNA repair protein RecO [Candidatus Portnoybacteria bacterium]MDD4982645.1 DNA repair protein RecO [Candidatus Portnoybacteria bacterium]